MDAIVLVGGQGTRLRPLTTKRHKSLVPLCNRPAIEYLLAWLERSGIRRVVLALGQDNEDLAEAFPGGRWGTLQLSIVRERERLESGGAIRNAVRSEGIEGRFLVLNGDVFVDFDLRAALAAHEEAQAELTLALYEVPDPSPFGVAVLDDKQMVTGFVEKPPPGTAPSNLVNAGVWIFEPHLVDEIPQGAVRVEETLFPSLVGRRRRVLGCVFDGLWADIGTPQRYLALNRALLASASCPAPSAKVAEDATIEASAIGPGCEVAPGASISDSVLWENVTVCEGAHISSSIVANGTVIGPGAVVEQAVVGAGVTISAGARVPAGTSLDAGARYDAPNEG
ncbi:MAG: NDP-sugar synthase [Dehalococcoidia bacterium]|nr:NDP-sugar synthase [Dehalococcoidia bacterium]